MLRVYQRRYPVSLGNEIIVKYFQIFQKNAIKVSGTQIDRNLALCHSNICLKDLILGSIV